jgi:hypothetical protein
LKINSQVRKPERLTKKVQSTVSAHNCQTNNRLAQIVLRRKIIDWRDKHLTEIELHLIKKLPTLMCEIDTELQNLSIYNSTIGISKVNQNMIQPIFNRWVNQRRRKLLKNAETELQNIQHTVLS